MFCSEIYLGGLSEMGARRYVTYLGAFGGTTLKPLELYATVPDHEMRHKLCRSQVQANVYKKLQRKYLPNTLVTTLCLYTASKGGKGGQMRDTRWPEKLWVSGSVGLKESASYPVEFCKAIGKMVSLVCVA